MLAANDHDYYAPRVPQQPQPALRLNLPLWTQGDTGADDDSEGKGDEQPVHGRVSTRHGDLYAEAERVGAAARLVVSRVPALRQLGEPRGLESLAAGLRARAVAGAAATTDDVELQQRVADRVCGYIAGASLPRARPSAVSLSIYDRPRRHYLTPRLRSALLACLDASRDLVNARVTREAAMLEDGLVSRALEAADRYAHYAHVRAAATMPMYADRVAALAHVATRMVPLVAADAECIRRCAAAYELVRRTDAEASKALEPDLARMMADAATHASNAEGMQYPLLRRYLEHTSRAPLDTAVADGVRREVDAALSLVPFHRAAALPATLDGLRVEECERAHMAKAYAAASAYAKRARGDAQRH